MRIELALVDVHDSALVSAGPAYEGNSMGSMGCSIGIHAVHITFLFINLFNGGSYACLSNG